MQVFHYILTLCTRTVQQSPKLTVNHKHNLIMATTEQRFQSLLEQHLGISDPDAINSSASDLGINSVDAVAFLKEVCKEFNVNISPGDAVKLGSMRAVVNHIDAAG